MDNSQKITDLTIISIDQLRELGIEMSDDELQALAQHVTDRVNTAIGEEIVDSLDDTQLKELLAMQDNSAPREEIEAWIIERVPEYDQIVEDNVAIVLGDLAKNVDSLSE